MHIAIPIKSQRLLAGKCDAVAAIMNASGQITFYYLGTHYFQFSHVGVEKTTGEC